MPVIKIISALLAALLMSGCAATVWNKKLDSKTKDEPNPQISKRALIQKDGGEVWSNFAQ